MRRAIGALLAGLLAWPAWAESRWQVTQESATEVVAVDVASFERSVDRVGFRQRHVLRGGQTDPHTLRRLREILAKRVIDCRARRIATLSRAVFDVQDALVDYQAVRLREAAWQPLKRGDPVFRLACGRS